MSLARRNFLAYFDVAPLRSNVKAQRQDIGGTGY
jgi:hypothetical protein